MIRDRPLAWALPHVALAGPWQLRVALVLPVGNLPVGPGLLNLKTVLSNVTPNIPFLSETLPNNTSSHVVVHSSHKSAGAASSRVQIVVLTSICVGARLAGCRWIWE